MIDSQPVQDGFLTGRILANPISTYLVGAGVLHTLIGATWMFLPSKSRELGISWFPGLAEPIVGCIWIAGGILAIVTGVRKRRRGYGFVGLISSTIFVGLVFLASSIVGFIPTDILPGGNPRSIITFISYLAIWWPAFLLYLVSPLLKRMVIPREGGGHE